MNIHTYIHKFINEFINTKQVDSMSVSDCKQVYLDDQMEDDCELGGNRW